MEGIHFKGTLMSVVISLFKSRNFSTVKMLREEMPGTKKDATEPTSLKNYPIHMEYPVYRYT